MITYFFTLSQKYLTQVLAVAGLLNALNFLTLIYMNQAL